MSTDSLIDLRDYFAAHCPLTLADAYHAFMDLPDVGEPTKEQLMERFSQMRFEYAYHMMKVRSNEN